MKRKDYELFEGTKSIPLNQLPSDAWSHFRGGSNMYRPASKEIEIKDKVGWLKRCLGLRAEGLASLPWSICDDKGNEIWTSTTEVIPQDLMWLENFEELLWLAEYSLLIRSEAYWQVNESYILDETFMFRRQISSLRWLAARTMEPVWSDETGLLGYNRRIGTNPEPTFFSPSEVVRIWIQNADHETEADEPFLTAAARSGEVLYHVDEFARQFFARGAIKATLLTVDKSSPKGERDRIRNWWTGIMSGISNAWKTEVVSSAVEPVVIGDGIQELSNGELTTEKRQDIATTLGIPHSLVFSNSANYATADVDRRNFYINAVIPSSRLIAKQVNRQLFRPRGFLLKFTPDRMSIFQADEHDRSTSFLNYVRGGMRPSIAAQILGISMPPGYSYDQIDEDFNEVQGAAEALLAKQTGKARTGFSDESQAFARSLEIADLKTTARKQGGMNLDEKLLQLLTRQEAESILDQEAGK